MWNQETVVERWIVDGDAKRVEAASNAGTRNGMVQKGRFYDYAIRLSEKARPKHTVVIKDRRYAEGFDVRRYLGVEVVSRLQSAIDHANDPRSGPWDITCGGSIVTVECHFGPNRSFINKYVFDLAKGAHLVVEYGKDNHVEDDIRYTYESVDGVWVPASYVHNSVSTRGVMLDKVVWSNSRVNRRMDKDQFSLARLGVTPGDLVQDDMALTQFTYVSDSEGRLGLGSNDSVPLPQPQVPVAEEAPASGWWLVVVSAILFAAVVVAGVLIGAKKAGGKA